MSSNFVKGDDMGALFESKMATLSRLIEAAKAVNAGAIVADGGCCEVDQEDMDELAAALREWGK